MLRLLNFNHVQFDHLTFIHCLRAFYPNFYASILGGGVLHSASALLPRRDDGVTDQHNETCVCVCSDKASTFVHETCLVIWYDAMCLLAHTHIYIYNITAGFLQYMVRLYYTERRTERRHSDIGDHV